MTDARKYRKKPIVIEATRWWKNGDHPDDGVGEPRTDPLSGEEYPAIEGAVVRFYRNPFDTGDRQCDECGRIMHDHGWIDTLEGGHNVCPGDWVITGVKGEHYPCKPDIFQATYEAERRLATSDKPSLRDEVARIVGEACGSASMCWNPRPEGVFDPALASRFVDEATDAVLALLGGDQ